MMYRMYCSSVLVVLHRISADGYSLALCNNGEGGDYHTVAPDLVNGGGNRQHALSNPPSQHS